VTLSDADTIGTAERLSKALGRRLLDTERAEASPWLPGIVLRPIGPAYLNRLTTALLAHFRSGTIAIPPSLDDLIAQLGSVVTTEHSTGCGSMPARGWASARTMTW
jgi:hypothetical protein